MPLDKLAVRGYVEVLRPLPRDRSASARSSTERLLDGPPDVFIGVDAPDFNLDLEAQAARRRHPDDALRQPVDLGLARRAHREDRDARPTCVLCMFPFEPAIYAKAASPATYVGHPLADVIPLEPPRAAGARRARAAATTQSLVALLPGSRRSEIQYIAPRLLRRRRASIASARPGAALRRAGRHRGCAHVVEPLLAAQYAPELPIELLVGRSHEALAACDVALVASGTATLEAALFKRPMVDHLRDARHHLADGASACATSPGSALPNILLREFVVPELLQDDATPGRRSPQAPCKLARRPGRAARPLQRRASTALHRELRRDSPARTDRSRR